MDVWGFSSGQRQNRQQGKENIFIFSIVIKFEILHQLSPYFANIYVGRKSVRSQTTFLSQTHLLNWQLGVLGQRHGAAIILLEEPLGIYTKSGMHGGGDTISDILEKISLKRGYNIIMQILHHSKCAQLECFQFHLEHL